MSEIPVHPHPRRLADWINPTEAKKVHLLIDKIYQRKNLGGCTSNCVTGNL